MKTLCVVTDSLDAGGAQKMLSFAINSISECVDQIIVILERNQISYPLASNIKVIEMRHFNNDNTTNNIFNKISRLFHYSVVAKKIIKEYQPCMVLAFGSYYSTMAYLATRGLKTKLIVSERRSPQMLSAEWKIISKYVYNNSDAIVFQLEEARKVYKNIKSNKCFIIPNPYISDLSIEPIDARNRKKIIAMAAARLEYEKGFDVGIEAFKIFQKKHPEFIMNVYGKGDYSTIYSECLIGARNVYFKGLSHDIVNDIKDVSVFLLPSRNEGIPNMLMEALGAGIPCVAADCSPGGPKLLIGDDERGILVPVESVNQTALSLEKIVMNHELSNKLSKNAQNIKYLFSENEIKKKWQDCIKFVGDGCES